MKKNLTKLPLSNTHLLVASTLTVSDIINPTLFAQALRL